MGLAEFEKVLIHNLVDFDLALRPSSSRGGSHSGIYSIVGYNPASKGNGLIQ